ncbi:AAA family ATPase [Pseudoalteromonas distincta]|uniref:AAA family ATPase n=1 Tax=Pseudoalteromonas distincta TaxID=77608 RepID=UPI00165FEE30|nr:AAA family ATPase [Pseudoalteromonas distincta]MBD0411082.1 AAA family ATPase [Pseudoalteromonas distincta]
MRAIEKVQIKNFRSFFGTTQNDKAEILNISDLNIFSGSNDSGKSNVLRALNLFFNGEIDNVHSFNFDTDFNIFKQNLTQKVIEIKVYFNVNKRNVSITKFYDRSGYRNFEYRFIHKDNDNEIIIDSRQNKNEQRYKNNNSILKQESGYRRSAMRLIQSISFSYVPAIREERFFSHLYGKIIYKIKKNEEKHIQNLITEKNKIERWEKTLENKSDKKEFKVNLSIPEWRSNRISQISQEISDIESLDKSIIGLESQINKFASNLFKATNFLSSEFKVGSNLLEFFESFDIGTGGDKNLSLRTRGDGVQARFIPEMLDFMDSISNDKKYFIWGFEEPENSAEYKNQQILASKLKLSFSVKKQIFITTHSEEFLSLYDGEEIDSAKRKANLYHVKKQTNKTQSESYSIIEQFDVEHQTFDFSTIKSDLENDIGSSLIRAKYSKEIKEKESKLLEKIEFLEKKELEFEEEYQRSKKWFVFLEDEYPEIYKVAYLKIENVTFTADNLEQKFQETSPFNVYSKNGQIELNKFLGSVVVDEWKKRKIIGLFDFDSAYDQFKGLNKNKWSPIEGEEKSCLFRRRKDHTDFYALVIPVPEFRETYASKNLGSKSALEIEMLFTDEQLERLNSLKKTDIAGTNDKISKFSGKKSTFWKSLIDLEPEEFKHFVPLFDKIKDLLE